MASVALLSNPRSTGNRALLPRVREYCAAHPDIFHYEVEDVDQIGEAIRTIAMVGPRVVVINGGDGTVQAALTELYSGGHFGGSPPPVAVLPNGKTNLIALDLGAEGDPIKALQRVIELVNSGQLEDHVIQRQLISLDSGGEARPVLGMFLGGAYLADVMLYCRNRIYPLGLPNGISHFLAAILGLFAMMFGLGGGRLPPKPQAMTVSLIRQGEYQGKFSLLIVTTLEKLLLSMRTNDAAGQSGQMKLLAVERGLGALVRMLGATWRGTLGQNQLDGVHFQQGDEIRIEGERSNVILDGEIFQAKTGMPIILTSTQPVPFLRLAA
ncbi:MULTISPECIES: diacylglycerol kinase family protein [unclassified Sphingopyxis]|jgi:diacylglycerol kinase family enzyme|uniref:diacylglycerol/lipid kinase family protein n=1 Tax=unclassified Sphingopyxis TaxID=2614943 RepID=UPI002854A883|nr:MULTISPECIES: diacylglycerol kinase family protein [unclassified Sphingopyxis]MDR6834418.1 diacylglycerol kinase family enzyme [Sphingopyxis sp. BE122]MDR7226687.1 diacylglycerol kinase family enzyme [Sphingopyxis sp. BE259]